MAASNYVTDGLTQILGALGGGFAAPTIVTGPEPTDTSVADLNDDGFDDVVAADAVADVVSVFYGGPGGLTIPVTYPISDLAGAAAVGDFDGDGRLDIAVTRYLVDGLVTVLHGQEGGGFADATDYPVGKYPRGLLAADLDSDLATDLAVANRGSNTLSVLINTTIP